MNSSRDAYDVLGVAPTSEEVVIRAAYRALMRKDLAAEDGDPRPEDRRARGVGAA
jgi:DnaJ-domain-containing protein 1